MNRLKDEMILRQPLTLELRIMYLLFYVAGVALMIYGSALEEVIFVCCASLYYFICW